MKFKWKVNVRDGIRLNRNDSKQINKNIDSDLYINVLKEKNNEMNKNSKKGYIKRK